VPVVELEDPAGDVVEEVAVVRTAMTVPSLGAKVLLETVTIASASEVVGGLVRGAGWTASTHRSRASATAAAELAAGKIIDDGLARWQREASMACATRGDSRHEVRRSFPDSWPVCTRWRPWSG